MEEPYRILRRILETKQFVVARADLACLALKHCTPAAGADFSDTLIAAVCMERGCIKALTFDERARASGMELL